MIKVLAKGIPLPFASVKNHRSLIYVDNLVDALILCATHSKAAWQTYLVSDGQDVSTPDLLCKLSNAMGKPVKLMPCSPIFMRLAGRLFRKSDQLDKLMGSLQIDSSKIRRDLGWKPPYTLDEGLKATVSNLK
jgi:nucleoside-diphosphate-sugar epimerase